MFHLSWWQNWMIWLICTRTFIYTQCILAKQEHFHCIESLSSSLLRSGYQTPYTSLSFWTHKFRNWRKKLKYQSVESDYTIFSCKFLNTHLTLIICCCSNIEIYFLQRSSYFACPRERSYMPHTIWEQRFLMEFMFVGVRFDECFLLN